MSELRSVHVLPSEVHKRLSEHLLVDGYRLVLDAERSHGSWLVDARDGREYLDLYTQFASAPLGANPPGIVDDPAFMVLLAGVAAGKPANPDMYTTHLAEFVETFARVLGDPALPVRLHDVADQHRPGQDRQVPGLRLAAHRRARRHLPTRGAPRRRRGRRGPCPGPGAGGVRGEPARHRV